MLAALQMLRFSDVVKNQLLQFSVEVTCLSLVALICVRNVELLNACQ